MIKSSLADHRLQFNFLVHTLKYGDFILTLKRHIEVFEISDSQPVESKHVGHMKILITRELSTQKKSGLKHIHSPNRVVQ